MCSRSCIGIVPCTELPLEKLLSMPDDRSPIAKNEDFVSVDIVFWVDSVDESVDGDRFPAHFGWPTLLMY